MEFVDDGDVRLEEDWTPSLTSTAPSTDTARGVAGKGAGAGGNTNAQQPDAEEEVVLDDEWQPF